MTAPPRTRPQTEPATTDVDLVIGGMTCASCAARVEKKLNKLDGVVATVNHATEQAKVSFPDTIDPADLIAQVESAGYTATLPEPARVEPGPDEGGEEPDDPTRSLRQR